MQSNEAADKTEISDSSIEVKSNSNESFYGFYIYLKSGDFREDNKCVLDNSTVGSVSPVFAESCDVM